MKACRKCRTIQKIKNNPRCYRCNSTNLTNDFTGKVFIIDPETSEIAERLNIETTGEYALKVR